LTTLALPVCVIPEPELFKPCRYIVTTGVVPEVDPRKVMSGMMRYTNAKLCPSPISNCAEVMSASIGSAVSVSLSSTPDSWSTRL